MISFVVPLAMARELASVTEGALVATSSRNATTSTIVDRGGDTLLMDPAWEPDELIGLADASTWRCSGDGVGQCTARETSPKPLCGSRSLVYTR